MEFEDKIKLLGKYSPLEVHRDDYLFCEIRGKVQVGGHTDAPIPWPRIKTSGRHVLIVTGDLVEALKTESAMAISYWWGVSTNTVRLWRRALGIDRMTPGSLRLSQLQAPEQFTPEVLEKSLKARQTPEVRAKMSAAKKGKPLHPNTLKALEAAREKPRSEAWKKQHSENMRKQWADGVRSVHNAWSEEEIALLGTDLDRVIAEKVGRRVEAVGVYRRKLGIPPFAKNKSHKT